MKRALLAIALALSTNTAHAYQQACYKLSDYAREVAFGRYSGIDKADQMQVVLGFGYQQNVKESLLSVVDMAYKLPATDRDDFQYAHSRWFADDVYRDCMKKFGKLYQNRR